MLACFAAHADEARSFTSIIRAQAEAPEASLQSEGASFDALAAAAQACTNPPASVVDKIMALLTGSECENVNSLSNIDTALQLGPR